MGGVLNELGSVGAPKEFYPPTETKLIMSHFSMFSLPLLSTLPGNRSTLEIPVGLKLPVSFL